MAYTTLSMDKLKSSTLIDSNITKTSDGYYRYVNQAEKLCTTGFGTKKALLKWTDCIRFDKNSVNLMRDRHVKIYNT